MLTLTCRRHSREGTILKNDGRRLYVHVKEVPHLDVGTPFAAIEVKAGIDVAAVYGILGIVIYAGPHVTEVRRSLVW